MRMSRSAIYSWAVLNIKCNRTLKSLLVIPNKIPGCLMGLRFYLFHFLSLSVATGWHSFP